jgi:choline dehydrogenase-like flavoprotein
MPVPSSNTFDAIVIGSGISGGWAAKELCEKGLKTLILERGRNVVHLKDYPTATKGPWEFPHHLRGTLKDATDNPILNRCYAYNEATQHFFVKDTEHPFVQEKPFDWVRGYQVGGKSLLWARQTQRWSEFEFEGPARDGFAVDWPLRYADLAPWYSHVEQFAGISGNKDGLAQLPDGEFLPPWEMNEVEKAVRGKIVAQYPDRPVIIGRCAHLTQPREIHIRQGRTQCQARSLCDRGCPFGGYFSSNASTIPWAEKTGNLTLRTDSVVHSIIYDENKKRATGVRVIDAHTLEATEYYARVIFVNASTMNTNLILLNSTSARFPNGLGNDSGLLGKYVAFHNYRGSAHGTMDGYEDSYYYGRKPTGILMPNFRNVRKQEMDFLRGYIVVYGASRGRGASAPSASGQPASGRHGSGQQASGQPASGTDSIGGDFKDALAEAGGWTVHMSMQGETIPKESNHVYLSKDKKDAWGIPQLVTNIAYDDNDEKIVKDFLEQASAMMTAAGVQNIQTHDSKQAPGLDIHEMGGVRMGKDPKTSLLNAYNQMHGCPNVLVTDGACMTSTGTQNPSLTYMAFTARAVDHAFQEMKKGNI